MSGGLGFANSFKEKVAVPLDNYRGNAAKPGKDITLEQYLKENFTNADNEAMSLDDLWVDFGLDPSHVSLENLLSANDDMKYLAPEIVRDFIYEGFIAKPWYKELCAASEPVDSMNVATPKLDADDANPEDVAQGETIPEGSVTYSDKLVKLTKKAKYLGWTDELLLSVKIPVLKPWLVRFGVRLSAQMNALAVSTLVNGDQSDSSDSCAVIGVASSGTLAFADFVTAVG